MKIVYLFLGLAAKQLFDLVHLAAIGRQSSTCLDIELLELHLRLVHGSVEQFSFLLLKQWTSFLSCTLHSRLVNGSVKQISYKTPETVDQTCYNHCHCWHSFFGIMNYWVDLHVGTQVCDCNNRTDSYYWSTFLRPLNYTGLPKSPSYLLNYVEPELEIQFLYIKI